ncbi:MBL fold metallo-hydrolase [Fuerstiella marisgermanici]|uniref:Metallo-beta-lactamase domain-containing protein n=1 Tax=Fuerstiella marisgermanici TaxID=1891926 RepID=A0A1P8WDJ5_9PLAN|nr:MBL fold metallo-hydrolase [Fuerstiella marisgermanici]APZ92130.1 hypothetical protein Fuma_01735 [Fuerstiella marisgermanici]
MKSRFVAIPVGQGDGFFYQDQNTSLLVDGGRSVRAIATQFQTALSRTKLDILICTHNDADHANGVLGLLESGIQCREVWLPGRWTERLKDLLANPYDFSRELYGDWQAAHEDLDKVGTLDEYGDILAIEDQRAEENEQPNEIDEGTDETLLDALENASAESDSLVPADYFFEFGPCPWIPYGPRGAKILADAVEAAARIRSIALAAFHVGATIRWFEYGNGQPVQHSTILPLNCREIVKVRRLDARALKYLALTKANKESLVFSVPPTDANPGVVFSADSDFDFSFNLNSNSEYLVTAPHHGAESNANAYTQLASVMNNGTFVRSDGKYRSRPGKSFLKLPSKRRFCTLCRGVDVPKQTLEFEGDASGWNATPAVRSCACQ